MLTTMKIVVTEVQLLLPGEFAMQLEVMMAEFLGCPCPPHSYGMQAW